MNAPTPPWSDAVRSFCDLLTQSVCTNSEQSPVPVQEAFEQWRGLADDIRQRDKTVYFAGNGASASMASHFSADLAKNGGLRTGVFTDLSLMTAIGNDINFEQVFAYPIERFGRAGDMLVAISSSGNSPNIVAAAKAARAKNMHVVTLSGFKADNQLRALGDLNFYVPATTYGLAETCHTAILHYWMDLMGN